MTTGMPPHLSQLMDPESPEVTKETLAGPMTNILEYFEPIHCLNVRDMEHLPEIQAAAEFSQDPSLVTDFQALHKTIAGLWPVIEKLQKPDAFAQHSTEYLCDLYNQLFCVLRSWTKNHRNVITAMVAYHVHEVNLMISHAPMVKATSAEESRQYLEYVHLRCAQIVQALSNSHHTYTTSKLQKRAFSPEYSDQELEQTLLSHLQTTVDVMKEIKPGYVWFIEDNIVQAPCTCA